MGVITPTVFEEDHIAPTVFEKDHIAATATEKIILILRICTHRCKRKKKNCAHSFKFLTMPLEDLKYPKHVLWDEKIQPNKNGIGNSKGIANMYVCMYVCISAII